MSIKIVSWNIAGRYAPWCVLAGMDADIALLQEARAPASEVASQIEVDPMPWGTAGIDGARAWRTAIARLSDRVAVEWIDAKPLDYAAPGELAVSRLGTLSAARVQAAGVEPILVISAYSLWTRPHISVGEWIYAGASAHRLISDLSALVDWPGGHRLLVAGDWNICYGYGEGGDAHWAGRYRSVFDRMEALGLSLAGPQFPNGLQADPQPEELPRGSKNVPTYRPANDASKAKHQLDFVFASNNLDVRVRALNEPGEWGPSDHCRLEIQVA